MAELLRTQGYAGTSIKQVVAAAGVPIGSIYHHFPDGKVMIAAAALRETGAVYIQMLPALLDAHEDLVVGVEAAFVAAAEDIEKTGWANMCPVGTVTGEVASAVPELREVADKVLSSWVVQGTAYFVGRGLSENDSRAAIYAVLTALEGAFILAAGQRSRDPLLVAGRATASFVATLIPRGRRQAPTAASHDGEQTAWT